MLAASMKRLTLRQETVRLLTADELRLVNGGVVAFTTTCTVKDPWPPPPPPLR